MNETESLRARIASLEAELAATHKRRAAIEAMEAYQNHATTHAQEIANESAGMMRRLFRDPHFAYPHTAEFLELRNKNKQTTWLYCIALRRQLFSVCLVLELTNYACAQDGQN